MIEVAHDELLSIATKEVLETMFFTEVLGDAEPLTALESHQLTARLSFHGAPPGAFSLRVTRQAARAIAADFLGLDQEEQASETQTGEVICELANMICGSVLSRLERDARFELSSPVLMSAAQAPEGTAAQAFCRAFDLGCGVLTVSLELQPGPLADLTENRP
jgi:CheY-specific phosphatase CheX